MLGVGLDEGYEGLKALLKHRPQHTNNAYKQNANTALRRAITRDVVTPYHGHNAKLADAGEATQVP